ncbi:MAG: WbqC family protein [Candidatus Gastranaerophilales bacterium]|nr:WbqC family protein [Candidatus Gastranaerophilales bacterium]
MTKKVAIMQPYFFPYIGYFSLIKHTDKFILFDPVQFIRHGWIERNRMLKPELGWQYISVPLVKHERETLIKDILINNNENWKEKIFAQLQHYKKKSPFYKQAIEVVQKGLDINTDSIVKLNYSTLKAVCEYLEITFDCEIFSEMNLTIDPVNAPDEWALNICNALGYKEYWNPQGGIEFFDVEKYRQSNIEIKFLKHNLPFYSQRRGVENFENGLSIIDVMMFNSKEQINEMLNNYELI